MTTSCLDGTSLPNYRLSQYPTGVNTYNAFYGDPSCDIPLWTHVTNLPSGYSAGDLMPYGLHYSHYLFYSQNESSSYSPPLITGNYQPYTDGAICQVCPDGFRIASAADFNVLRQFLSGKDIYDVSETCIKPVGGGHVVTIPQIRTNADGNYFGAVTVNASIDFIWSPVYSSVSSLHHPYVEPYDIHFSANYGGIESGYGNLGIHKVVRTDYRSIRCIKE